MVGKIRKIGQQWTVWQKNSCIFAVLFTLYTYIGFLIVPLIIQNQLQKKGSEILGRQVEVHDVALNPYCFKSI